MKKKISLATAAIVFVGVFAAIPYLNNLSQTENEYGILTPTSEEADYEQSFSMTIYETSVPLSDGPGASTNEESTPQNADPYVQKIADLVNEEREKAGLAPLTLVSETNGAAAIRAEEIYSVFAHERPDGSKYRTVLDQCGITYGFCGENVAYGYRTPKAVMDGWMNSEGHKANILNERFTKIGVGHYVGPNGYHYWSQLFTD